MSTFHSSRNISVKNLFVLSFKHAKFLHWSHNSSFYNCILCIVIIRSNRDQDKRKRSLRHIVFDIELIHTQRWVQYVSGWFKRSLKFPWVRILKSADHRQAGDCAKLEVATALDLHGHSKAEGADGLWEYMTPGLHIHTHSSVHRTLGSAGP